MNPTDPNTLLSQLKPLQAPDPIGLWPPAIGWWISLLILIVLIVVVYSAVKRHILRNQYRKKALVSLQHIDPDLNVLAYSDALAQLITRTLKATARGQAIIQLDKTSLQRCLNQTMTAEMTQWFLQERYKPAPSSEFDKAALQLAVKTWIKKHRL